MSGYLDVKCSARASRGLFVFKAWKKQWCILRPHPTEENIGVLAVHSSVDVLANSTIELPAGSTVCRTKSRTHEFAFGVFLAGGFRKPHVLLAGQTESETQMWIAKIRAVLNGKKLFRRNVYLKNSFEVSIIDNEFSHSCLLYGLHGTLTVSSHGLIMSQPDHEQVKIFIAWKHFTDIIPVRSSNVLDTNKIYQLITNSGFSGGAGRLNVFCTSGPELVTAIREAHLAAGAHALQSKRISRSEGDLYNWISTNDDSESAVIRRSSWYSRPSDVSLDDTDLVMTKETNIVPSGQLSRCSAADDLFPVTSRQHLLSYVRKFSQTYADSPSSDRRSCSSLASGIYEEIAEDSNVAFENGQNQQTVGSMPMEISMNFEENTYESVAECVYATMRRTGKRFPPPPLPPRIANSCSPSSITKLDSWSTQLGDAGNMPDETDGAVMRHASLGSLPRCYSGPSHQHHYNKTMPKLNKNKHFNVFRKRIKSESRVPTLSKDKIVEPKKKKFDFGTPSSMIKNLSVSKALMKNLRISNSSLRNLGEARSCEHLDNANVVSVAEPRTSKSAEVLGAVEMTSVEALDLTGSREEDGQDLSEIYSENEQFSLPHDIVELILRGRDDLAAVRLRQRQLSESDYILMSPAGQAAAAAACATVPVTTTEEHYAIMTSPSPSIQPITSVTADIAT